MKTSNDLVNMKQTRITLDIPCGSKEHYAMLDYLNKNKLCYSSAPFDQLEQSPQPSQEGKTTDELVIGILINHSIPPFSAIPVGKGQVYILQLLKTAMETYASQFKQVPKSDEVLQKAIDWCDEEKYSANNDDHNDGYNKALTHCKQFLQSLQQK